MPPTNVSSPTASPVGSFRPDPPRPAPGGVCAIHQPNLFPRLSTLAKLFAADCWIVLDDVQFTRRDYQHRARLATLEEPDRWQWLSISTHLPQGRSTLISEARITENRRCSRRTQQMIQQFYRSSPYWPDLEAGLEQVIDVFAHTDRTAEVAEASTRMMLDLLGWQGTILHSSQLLARTGRSERLVDLAAAISAKSYLCGTGGLRYLDPEPFRQAGIEVRPFRTPAGGMWTHSRTLSGLAAMATCGLDVLASQRT